VGPALTQSGRGHGCHAVHIDVKPGTNDLFGSTKRRLLLDPNELRSADPGLDDFGAQNLAIPFAQLARFVGLENDVRELDR
jgi:hypothetical protein